MKTFTRLYLLTTLLVLPGLAQAATAVPFTVNTSETVTVNTAGGTPRLQLDVGGATRYADYTTGSGSAALTFTYTTQAGDVDLDGITVSSPLQLNGGVIADAAGNTLSPLTFSVPSTTGVRVEHPSLAMDFMAGDYILNGTHYNSLASFLTATGGTFSRGSVGTYFDSAGVMQTATAGTARFDYDPVTHAAKGILIEEARTNAMRNSSMTGASVGVFPTNWTVQPATGITTSVVGTGIENGINYIDVRIVGTPSGAGNPAVFFEGVNIAAASMGQTWAVSGYMRLIAGSYTNISFPSLGSQIFNSGGGYLGGTSAGTINATTAALSSQRYSYTTTIANASTAFIRPIFSCAVTNGLAVDLTLRIGAPQIELGQFVTSYIPTTNAVATRQQDNLSLPAGAWFDQTNGAWMVQAQPYANIPASPRLIAAASSAGSFLNVTAQTVTTYAAQAFDGTVASTGNSFAAANNTKMAGLYDATNKVVAAAGGSISSVARVGTYPLTPTATIYIGRASPGNQLYSGRIGLIKYYPARITNTQLQLLTQ